MLSTRIDQENLIHQQQTAAAAKPLNQGVRGLTAKTPGNKAPKTPFKVPLNDENAQYNPGKSVLKTNGKGLDKISAFVTPAGPKNRPALGNKTTNAKANVFKTPANKNVDQSPIKTQKPGSPRLRRKLQVLKPEFVEPESEEEVDIEYMPPKEQHIDSDDEFGPDKTFPQLAPENLTRNWASICLAPVGEDGLTPFEREQQQRQDKYEKESHEKLQKLADEQFQETENELRREFGMPIKKETLSKSAAEALSKSSKPTTTTQKSLSVRPRSNLALNMRKNRAPVGSAPPPKAPTAASKRFASASAASKNTLGYAQGRAVSQKVRRPLTQIFRDGETAASKKSNDNVAATRLRIADLGLDDHEEGEDSLFGDLHAVSGIDDEFDDFQFPMPTTN